jgi:multicomponent Na+:H+ antiporter subunit E
LLRFATAWILWSGYFKPLLLGLGVVSVLASAYLGWRMRRTDGEGPGFSVLDHIHQLATYWPWLLVEVAKSNIAVARIVLAPRITLIRC